MKQIAEQLRELGFERTANAYQCDYVRDSLHVEIFDSNHLYMVATIPAKPTVWCGAHFPLTMPVADALAIVTEHQQALYAAVVAALTERDDT